jgi:cytoskeletal protein RodZ
MSSILKALRKLEKEKPQAGPSAANISVDQGAAAKRSGSLLPLLTGVVLGAAMVGVLLLWQPGVPVSRQGNQADVNKPDGSATTSGSAQSAEQPKPQNKLAELNREASRNAQEIPVVQGPEQARIIDPVQVVVFPREKVATDVPRPDKPLPAAAAKPTFKAADPTVAAAEQSPPSGRLANVSVPAADNSGASSKLPEGVTLRVSEIYYQDNGAGSMAVVNDLPVMIGSQVDTAVIKDIRPDRVLVSIAGKLYAVALTKQ